MCAALRGSETSKETASFSLSHQSWPPPLDLNVAFSDACVQACIL